MGVAAEDLPIAMRGKVQSILDLIEKLGLQDEGPRETLRTLQAVVAIVGGSHPGFIGQRPCVVIPQE
jgi:hypothetical protein